MSATPATAARQEVLARADHQLAARRLIVDFYRIRRQIAYPIPIRDTGVLQINTRNITGAYPWDVWMAWAVEERVAALGWAGEWTGESRYRGTAIAELTGVAGWRRYGTDRITGLGTGHLARIMYRAKRNWQWLDDDTCTALHEAGQTIVDTYADYLAEEDRTWTAIAEGRATRERPYANIHFILGIGLSLAARLADHPRRNDLETYAARFIRAILDQQAAGVTEGLGYDGYMLDFMADWLVDADPDVRDDLLAHESVSPMIRQSWALSAPGEGMNVARLGDIEPVEMPFHASAIAALRQFVDEPAIDAYLNQCDPARLRTDALAQLITTPPDPAAELTPEPTTRTSLVLRSGYQQSDLAAVMSCHQSPMGHLHDDNGSLVIGSGGHWLIDDPGYQQYLATSERAFTMEPGAHNSPVINNIPPFQRAGKPLHAPRTIADGLTGMAMDNTGCYPDHAGCQRVERHVWLIGRDAIIVADRLAARDPAKIQVTWHGTPEAGWYAEDGLALVVRDSGLLWIRDFQQALNTSHIERRRGSRGHQSITLEHQIQGEATLWWGFGDQALLTAATRHDDSLQIAGHQLRIG